jgi:hypothetical protein
MASTLSTVGKGGWSWIYIQIKESFFIRFKTMASKVNLRASFDEKA